MKVGHRSLFTPPPALPSPASLLPSSSCSRRRKGVCVKPLNHRSPNVWTSQSCFFSSNWLFVCEHLFIDKRMVITAHWIKRTAVRRGSFLFPEPLGLICVSRPRDHETTDSGDENGADSKLCSKLKRMLSDGFTRSSRMPKSSNRKKGSDLALKS